MKELREAAGLTQKQVAELIHVARSTVAMWESGRSRPLFQNLLRLSKLYNCSIDALTEAIERAA